MPICQIGGGGRGSSGCGPAAITARCAHIRSDWVWSGRVVEFVFVLIGSVGGQFKSAQSSRSASVAAVLVVAMVGVAAIAAAIAVLYCLCAM